MKFYFLLLCIALFANIYAQPYTSADTLRGSLSPSRTWFNVQQYALYLIPNYKAKTLTGTNTITFKALRSAVTMQLDLQPGMSIDKITLPGQPAPTIVRNGAAHFITFKNMFTANNTYSIVVQFSGKPIEAVRPPWDGGLIFAKDAKGRPWLSTACQGLGASAWWPCKDHQSDEPDNGTNITIEAEGKLKTVSNGKLIAAKQTAKTNTETWQVTQPINSYNICMNIGNYVSFKDTFNGLNGVLPLTYYVLDYNLAKAKTQFAQVKPMLRAFEYWFGPYPFYADGYKLVETPFLGMEHQSATAYGNGFKNGYLGQDLSGTGWGLKWDYILVHESGHEWFGNNISTNDIADMWVHEGFTNYSEALYTEYYYGKNAGNEYVKGLRKNIQNNTPIIGPYNVNKEGSGDMYYKGANLIHTIRQVIDNDSLFRAILIGLNTNFYHKTVTTQEVESYISRNARKDFSTVFNQYLRTTQIPKLIVQFANNELKYKWANTIDGFNMPLKILINNIPTIIKPTETFQTHSAVNNYKIDNNYYIDIKITD